MLAAAPTLQVTPERIFNSINAHQVSNALKAAIQLGIFTAIADGNSTAGDIASRCQCAARGARILCDFLTIQGFLAKDGDHYDLTPESDTFLNEHSQAYLGCAIEFLLSPDLVDAHSGLTDAVKNGGSALRREGIMVAENPAWVQFAEAMMPFMYVPARALAEQLSKRGPITNVLDIAAGHGMFGIAIAKQNQKAHIFASDWKNVLEVAQRNAYTMQVSDRYHLLPGSCFDQDLGHGYDLALVPNFLHHFDSQTCIALLRKLHGALIPGGRIAVLEFIPNPDRVTPPTAAAFSLMMLATTPSGDAYTFSELLDMLESAGFVGPELAEEEFGIDRLVVAFR